MPQLDCKTEQNQPDCVRRFIPKCPATLSGIPLNPMDSNGTAASRAYFNTKFILIRPRHHEYHVRQSDQFRLLVQATCSHPIRSIFASLQHRERGELRQRLSWPL